MIHLKRKLNPRPRLRWKYHPGCLFDYDHDGDLDAYLVTNVMNMRGPNNIRKKGVSDSSSPNADKLLRNNGNGTFTDVFVKNRGFWKKATV